jgi:predicted HTH transcriptional regulator
MLFNKTVDSIEEADLQELVDTQVRESKELDYKEHLSVEQPSEKKEFLNDISSFANASGGYLIYGIKESKEDAGSPVELSGLQLDNP